MLQRIALALLLCFTLLSPGQAADAQGRPVARWMQSAHSHTVNCVACSPAIYMDQTGTWTILASAGVENTVKFWRYTLSPGTAGNSNSRLLATLVGHTDAITSLAFSPDGKTLASASLDGSVKWWNVGNGVNVTLLRTTYHDDGVTAVAFAPNGKWLVSAGYDQTVRLWNTADYSQAHLYVTTANPLCVAFSPASDAIAFGEDDGSLLRIRLADNVPTFFFTGTNNPITSLSFASKGPSYLAAGSGGTVYVWNLASNGSTLVVSLAPLAGTINAATFSPDGSLLLAGGDDGALRIWHTSDFSAAGVLPGFTGPVNALAFTPGSQIFSSGDDNTIKLWQLLTGQALTGTVVWTPLGHTNAVTSTAFSPDGNTLVSCGVDGVLKSWRTVDGVLQNAVSLGSAAPLLTAAFSLDGSLIATGSGAKDTSIRLWNPNLTLKKQLPRLAGPLYTLAFSPTRPQFASGDGSGGLYLWNSSDYSSLRLGGAVNMGAIYAVAFSPDGNTLVSTGKDKTIRLWRTDTSGALIKAVGGHTDSVYALALSPDGKALASGGDDNTVRLWNFPAMTLLGTLPIGNSVKSLAFSPDGATLAVGAAGSDTFHLLLQLWRFPARTLYQAYDQETAGGILDLMFSPESSLLAYGRGDGTVAVAGNSNYATPTPISIVANPTAIKGGSSAVVTVTLNAPAPLFTGTLVYLSSSSPIVKVPAGVTVPPGKKSVSFTATTLAVAVRATITLSAQLKQGVPLVSTTVTVSP